jgi:hypothetical protein
MALKIEWRKILGTVAPALATAAGGPLAGAAVKAIASKVLNKPEATQDEVEAAVVGADSQTLLKLRELDQQFAKDMQAAGIRLEEIEAEDRANARAREIAVRDRTPAALALLITTGFFGTLGWMLVNGKPATGGDALLVMLGALGGAWASVCSYYFGSSAGSKLKTEALAKR